MIEYVCIVVALGIRLYIQCYGYSGYNTPPKYGDFEAQRHWMEITTSIPIGTWYKETKENDLQYWGLDYPPLTAFHSWLCGMIAHYIYPPLVELHTSRGHESLYGKIYMRSTVIISDIIIYFPAIYLLLKSILKQDNNQSKSSTFQLSLFSLLCFNITSLLLIDHGHFQYNGVSIGFTLLSIYNLYYHQDIYGSIFFCLALNFKQMTLYYAPVFFFYLLRKCWIQPTILDKILHLVKIGMSVIGTFALLWSPFCIYKDISETNITSLLLIVQRIFPFKRGIFEDKVANLWYAFSVIYDYREHTSIHPYLPLCSLLLTLLLITPICTMLLTYTTNNKKVLLLALINCSLAFFLASFQVHEKSLLLSLVPSIFLLPNDPILVLWYQLLGSFTMFPLLIRDGLRVPYYILQVLYLTIIVIYHERLTTEHIPISYIYSKNTSTAVTTSTTCTASTTHTTTVNAATGESHHQETPLVSKSPTASNSPTSSCWTLFKHINITILYRLKYIFIFLSFTGMILLHILEVYYPPPSRYPDLYSALFSLYGVCNLLVVYAITIIYMYYVLNYENDDVTINKQKIN